MTGMGATMTEELALKIITLAKQAHLTIASVESITGGRVASALTGISGASSVVKGGVVTYTDEIKHRVIGVARETLSTVGAVSPECAREMAAGGKNVLQVDMAVSITGFAGPAGPDDNHPVGTVYYGLATADGIAVYHAQHHGDRAQIQAAATKQALLIILAALNNQNAVDFSSPFIDYPFTQEFTTDKE